DLCVRLQRAGIPAKRAPHQVPIHHPQWLGARIMWADGMREAELARVDYDVRERSQYIDSPANEIHDGATEVRENLERDPSLGRKHVIYDEMRAKGLTDYVAWPLYHTLGKRHIVTFATDPEVTNKRISPVGTRRPRCWRPRRDGVLVIAALTIQMATAAPRSARKASRAP